MPGIATRWLAPNALTSKPCSTPILIAVCGQLKKFILHKLESEGINTDLTEIEGSSRINIKVMENEENNVVELNEYGPQVLSRESEMLLNKIKTKCKKGDYFILAGSLPQNVDNNIYGLMIEMLHQKGARVLLDASGKPLKLGIEAIPDFLKINLEELKSINGGDIKSLVKKYNRSGISRIMITNGAKEVIYSDSSNLLTAVPPKIKGMATVGSGDSVDAGFIYGIINKLDPIDLLKTSIACGSANLFTNIPGKIEPEVVKKLTGRVRVKKL
ncbi:MAG: 1-phosphofructokinase family hexose kinase [Actinomycetota bacterium]